MPEAAPLLPRPGRELPEQDHLAIEAACFGEKSSA